MIVYLVITQPLDRHGLLRVGKPRVETVWSNWRTARKQVRAYEEFYPQRCAWIEAVEVKIRA